MHEDETNDEEHFEAGRDGEAVRAVETRRVFRGQASLRGRASAQDSHARLGVHAHALGAFRGDI